MKLTEAAEVGSFLDVIQILTLKTYTEHEFYKSLVCLIENYDETKMLKYFFSAGVDNEKAASYLKCKLTDRALQSGNLELFKLAVLNGEEVDCDDLMEYILDGETVESFEILSLLLATAKLTDINKAIEIAENNECFRIAIFLRRILGENIENIDNNYRILGEGADGCVITPDFEEGEGFVTKVYRNDRDAFNEYQIYKRLPKEGPYINPEEVKLVVTTEPQKIIVDYLSRNLDSKMSDYRLLMPKFEGKTFQYLIYNFNGLVEWGVIMYQFLVFCNDLTEFKNNLGFNHGDLHPENIIFTSDKRFIMIDLVRSYFDDSDKVLRHIHLGMNLQGLSKYAYTLLKYGNRKPEIREFLESKGIIVDMNLQYDYDILGKLVDVLQHM